MKLVTPPKRKNQKDTKREYTVAFHCASSFLVGFEDASGLTDRQILEKAVQMASKTFENGANLKIEHSSHLGFYELTALGIDRSSANILGKEPQDRPKLVLVKSEGDH